MRAIPSSPIGNPFSRSVSSRDGVLPIAKTSSTDVTMSIDMNKDQVKGAATKAAGKIQEKAGEITGSTEQQTKGALKQAKGAAQESAGDAKEAVKDTAEKVKDKI